MSASVFEYRGYKEYLLALVGERDRKSGLRAAVARALQCQPTYVSQVLYRSAHFSLEQADAISDFLGHSREERQFFLLLVQKERAGTVRLARFFDEEIQRALKARLSLTARLGQKNTLSEAHRSVYYSSWQYAAVHMALTIPELGTFAALQKYLSISSARLTTILEFLCSTGLALKTPQGYKSGESQIRLGNASADIIKHHTHWRQQAIESLERETMADLHYSAAVTLSADDVFKIKDGILAFIQANIKKIRDSKEEELYCLNMDFFSLKKS